MDGKDCFIAYKDYGLDQINRQRHVTPVRNMKDFYRESHFDVAASPELGQRTNPAADKIPDAFYFESMIAGKVGN